MSHHPPELSASMSDEEIVAMLNRGMSAPLRTLGAEVLAYDSQSTRATVAYQAVPAFCHSETIVQGGFITGMVDSAMALAVFGKFGYRVRLPTLEIKVSFISPGNPGRLVATAWPVHLGRSTAFLEGELHQDGRLVARASQTARLLFRSERNST